MEETTYPRQPGSETRIDKDQGAMNAPFGHCPACGSIGIEELHLAEAPEINFFCSDETCRDLNGFRTLWNALKPPELKHQETFEGWSWNDEHFPGQDLPDMCPD